MMTIPTLVDIKIPLSQILPPVRTILFMPHLFTATAYLFSFLAAFMGAWFSGNFFSLLRDALAIEGGLQVMGHNEPKLLFSFLAAFALPTLLSYFFHRGAPLKRRKPSQASSLGHPFLLPPLPSILAF